MTGLRWCCRGIAALVLAWSGQQAQAQWEPPAGGPPPGQPGMKSQLPPNPFAVPVTQAGHWTPDMASQGIQQTQFEVPMAGPPQAGPPAAGPLNPYPGIDMYRYGFQQNINQNGLWYQELRNSSKNYYGRVEYIVPVYNSPGDKLFGYGGIETGIVATDRIPPSYFSIPRDQGTVTTGGGNNNSNTSIAGREVYDRYFPYYEFNEMFDDMSGSGIALEFGVESEDGSGWAINGWYGGESNESYSNGGVPRRAYTPIAGGDPFAFLGNDPLYVLELSALNGSLPINNGSGVADRIPFDTLYEMQYSQQAWGSGLKFYRPAISRGDWYQFRPIVGLRYLNIREGFNFRGLDSGAEYEFLNFNDIDVPQEFETLLQLDFGFVTVGNNNTGQPGFEGRPDPSTFNDGPIEGIQSVVNPVDFFPTNPYETQVAASTQAQAAGPELGIEAEFGGDTTRLILTAIGGLTATRENIRLDGFGVYNHFINNVDPDADILTPDGGEMGTGVGGLLDEDTRFRDRATSTHVSPILDLSLRFESQLFQYVPVLNRFEFFEEAHFSTSYGFLYVGNLSRPQNSVNYTTFPINPSLDPNRSGWTMTQWTFGLTWER
ncbi:MAG: hypothetical protein KDA78_03895 [Planctomycetaceae bacterium]|nr:hypothetical protein [Planctomycetaceae bacterium]